MTKPLEGKTAVVTAASEGIGEACAKAYADAGAKVVAISRSEEKLAKAFGDYSGQVSTLSLDLLTIEGGDNVVPQSIEILGHIDIFHGNVGFYLPGDKLLEHTKQEMRDATRLNLGVQKDNVHDAVSHMVERGEGGQIILSSSWAAHVDTLFEENYAADKAALSKFARITHRQYADHGIRISTVSPAATVTPLLLNGWEKEKLDALMEIGVTTTDDVAAAAMTILTSEAYIPDIPLIPEKFSLERVTEQATRKDEREKVLAEIRESSSTEAQIALATATYGGEVQGTPKPDMK